MAVPAIAGYIMAGAAVIGAGVSVYTAIQQAEAADAATAIAQDNARMVEQETAMAVANLEEQQSYVLSMAKARSAASGVTGVSPALYIEDMKQEGIEEVEWLKTVGVSAYNQAIAAGETASAQAEAGMWGSIGQATSQIGQAVTAWPDQ